MNIYEFEAKEILAQYGVPVPEGRVASTAEEAEAVARALPGHKFAVKAQILAGGRGLAGGVELAAAPSKVGAIAKRMLGTRLVTAQTRREGEKVEQVYVEAAVEAERDLFLAVLVDQDSAALTVLGAAEGGIDFEARADGSVDDAAADAFIAKLGLAGAAAAEAREIVRALVHVFLRIDATLIEINPLTLTRDGALVAVDAKVSIDNNALYRHPEFQGLASGAAADEIEMQAQKDEINLVRLDGDIGIVVNGAGLALATQDMLADAGGRAANFMDIRTTATSLQVARGIGILLADPAVKVILVNVHGGGMTTCDTIAEAVQLALAWSERKLPVVMCLAGQNAEYARGMLQSRGVAHEPASGIGAGVRRAIEIAA